MSIDINRRTCVAVLALAAACPPEARAQAKMVDSSALQADADLLHRAYTALHPGLLRYQTADEAQARFADLRDALSRPKTLANAYVAFSRATAAVRCGHSFLNPANQEGPGLALMADGRNRLPFRFAWLNGAMIVLDGGGADPALRPGVEVVSIGDVHCRTLLRSLTPLVPADGHNDAKRIRSLDLRGEEDWPLFDVLLPLAHPDLVRGGTARLEVRAPGEAASRRVDLALLNRAERERTIRSGVLIGGSNQPAWGMERLASGAGWLTMPSWAAFDSKWPWRASLEADLDQLAADKAPGLVVDLRGNVGGLDVGEVILSRLVDRDTEKLSQRRLTRYRSTPADLNRFLKTWDRSFRDWGASASGPDPQGFYSLKEGGEDGSDVIQPRGRRFRGKVAVLIDASNSSATFQFADTIKRHGLATLVGQTTGGNRSGVNGGAFFFLQLPGSGLEVDLPLIGYYPNSAEPDAGVEPDLPVEITAADVAARRDPQRLAALAQVSG